MEKMLLRKIIAGKHSKFSVVKLHCLFSVLDLNSTNNITLDETVVSFFFGDRVLIPDDNILIDDEQCFEIGLDCTIRNLSTLTNGQRISFQAFVETDNKVRTPTRSVSITVGLIKNSTSLRPKPRRKLLNNDHN